MLGFGIIVDGVAIPATGGAAPAANPLQGAIFISREVAPTPHPPPFVWAGIQGPDAIPPTVRRIALTTQEQPYHPGSFVLRGVQPVFQLPPPITYVFTRQEQPWHPDSRFWTFPPKNVAAAGQITDRAITVQEQPWHPTYPRPPEVPGMQFISIVGVGRGYILH